MISTEKMDYECSLTELETATQALVTELELVGLAMLVPQVVPAMLAMTRAVVKDSLPSPEPQTPSTGETTSPKT